MIVKKKDNQKGVALVSTMILIALLAIMSGALLQMAYLTYSRKVVEKRTTETFYTAESCIDTIKAAVQNSVSAAIPKAGSSKEEFASAAFNALTGMVVTNVGSAVYDASSSDLYKFLKDKITKETDLNGNVKAKTDAAFYNGYTSSNPDDSNGPTYIEKGITSVAAGGLGGDFTIGNVIINAASEVVIKDVYIKFVNKQGYVAELKTDIVINAPVYAGDIPIQTGSYSMFAGNGASVDGTKDSGEIVYIHQEGNVYVGYDKDTLGSTITTLEMNGAYQGQCYFSIGGTNIILNGNIYLHDGSTLIFTGGDGKEGANVQVNGYIYLDNESTLLLAPNVNLVCKGIKVKDSGMSDYVNYEGTAVADTTISQFYPAKETQIAAKAGTVYSAEFDANLRDIAEVLQYADIGDDALASKSDPRYQKVYGSEDAKCGVYMLNASHDSTNGFTNRVSDKYYLLTCSGGLWSCSKAGLYDGQITCNPADSKLKLVSKITYNGKLYDREYAKIVNIPLLAVYGDYCNSALLTKAYTNYDTNSNTTYSTYSWSKIPDKFKLLSNYASAKSAILDNINWNDVNVASDFEDEDELAADMLFGERAFRIPTDLSTTSTLSSDSLNVATTLTAAGSTAAKTFTISSNQVGVGAISGQGVVTPNNNTYCLFLADNNLTVHIPDYYSGIFMSSQQVKYEQCSGYSRGISLLELAKNTSNYKGIDNKDNDVHKALEKLAKCWITKSWTENFLNGVWNNGAGELTDIAGFNLFDNIFSGGVSTFWNLKENANANKLQSDADGKDFVGTDNWEKDPS